MDATNATRASIASRISDLPHAYQSAAAGLQPALAEVSKRFSPLDTVRILTAAMGEQLAALPKAKGSLAMAQMRGAVAREDLKRSEGGSLSADAAAELLGISKAAVLKRYQKGQLIGWREAKQNAVRFPVWQFQDDNLLPGLSEVLELFRTAPWLDDWARVVFFLSPLSSMKGKRPLDLLREGDLRGVLSAAQANLE
ncbi:hypothetical protein [Luteolibacter sp. Populi]|uniref:hypothetical protein n=1 Tax=Luteolibacter sp. Populi TaxID=3230487 RepID=UPI0034658836